VVEGKIEKEKTRTGMKKEAETQAPPKKSKLVLFVGAGLIVFIVFLVFFSFSLGVFDKERLKGELGLTEDTTASITQAQPEDSAAEVYAEEDKSAMEPEGDTTAVASEDSVKNWIDEQKAKIQEDRTVVEVQRRELELLKVEVDNLLKQKKALESERIAKLAKIYDGMKAQEVAAMMNNLDDDTVVAVLLRMSTRNAAKVLGLLNPERAARISNKLMALK
jgi:flagellar motility protein MotE (MotC chaperone)